MSDGAPPTDWPGRIIQRPTTYPPAWDPEKLERAQSFESMRDVFELIAGSDWGIVLYLRDGTTLEGYPDRLGRTRMLLTERVSPFNSEDLAWVVPYAAVDPGRLFLWEPDEPVTRVLPELPDEEWRKFDVEPVPPCRLFRLTGERRIW